MNHAVPRRYFGLRHRRLRDERLGTVELLVTGQQLDDLGRHRGHAFERVDGEVGGTITGNVLLQRRQ